MLESALIFVLILVAVVVISNLVVEAISPSPTITLVIRYLLGFGALIALIHKFWPLVSHYLV